MALKFAIYRVWDNDILSNSLHYKKHEICIIRRKPVKIQKDISVKYNNCVFKIHIVYIDSRAVGFEPFTNYSFADLEGRCVYQFRHAPIFHNKTFSIFKYLLLSLRNDLYVDLFFINLIVLFLLNIFLKRPSNQEEA